MSLNTIDQRGPTVLTGAAAAGSNQATATPIGSHHVSIEVVSTPVGSGILLPTNRIRAQVMVRNAGDQTVAVYPKPGCTIDNGPVNNPYSLAAGGSVYLWASSLTNWYSFGSGVASTPGYNAPAFTSFDISGQATVLEVGDSVPAGSTTFEWGTSNSGNVQTNSIAIADTTAAVTLGSSLPNTGSAVLTLTEITNTATATQVWTITGLDTHGTTFADTFDVAWEFRMHAGDSANSTLTGAQILVLALNPLQSSPAGDYAITTGTNYKYFCMPDSMGDITSIIDPAVGFPIALAQTAPYTNSTASGLTYALVSVTNSFSVVESYRVFRTDNMVGGPLTMRVS